MSRNASNFQIQKIRIFSRFDLIRFIGDELFVLSTHYIVNIVYSIFFFLILSIDSLLLIIRSENQIRTSTFSGTDVLFYFLSFTVEHPDSLEMTIVKTIDFVFLFSFTILFILIFALKVNDFPFLRSLFCFLCYYLMPILLPTLCNSAGVSYRISSDDSDGLLTKVIFILHCIVLLIFAFTAVTMFFSPFYINHPLAMTGSIQNGLMLCYLTIFLHCHVSRSEWVVFLRLILSCWVLISSLFFPPYLSVYENFLFLVFIANEVSSCIMYIAINQRDDRINSLVYSIPVCFIFSLFIALVVYPFIVLRFKKNGNVLRSFYFHMLNKCNNYLDLANIHQAPYFNLRKLIIISLYLNSAKTKDLLLIFQRRILFIFDTMFYWIANNRLNAINKYVSKKLLKQVTYYEKKVDECNQRFWANVYHSNIYVLPEIASQIGHNKYRYMKYTRFLNRKYPFLEFPNEITDKKKHGVCSKITSNFGALDFILLLTFCAYFVGHALILYSGTGITDFFQNFLLIKKFSSYYLMFQADILESNSLSKALETWGLMLDTLNQIENQNYRIKSEQTYNMMNNITSLITKLDEYLSIRSETDSFEASASFFPFADVTFMYQIFDDFFNNSYTIFGDLTKSNSEPARYYTYAVVVFFPLITILTIIGFIIFLRTKITILFESFRTANKHNLPEAYKNLSKIEHRERFQFYKALPGYTIYFIFIIISTLMLTLILVFNQINNEFNYHETSVRSYGLSEVQRVDIWFTSTMTHFSFKEYNDTYESIFFQSLLTADRFYDSMRRNSTLDFYTSIIPEELLANISHAIIDHNINSLSEWQDLHDYFNQDIITYSDGFNYLPHFYIARFIVFLLCTAILYSWLVYFLIEVTPFYKFELKEFYLKAKEARIQTVFTSIKFKDSSVPINFYQIDPSMNILFASDLARKQNKIQVHSKLKTNGFIDAEVEKFITKTTRDSLSIKTKNSTIYLIPKYDFSIKSMELQNVLIINVKDKVASVTNEVFQKLFYSIYPRFISTDTDFPLLIDPHMKQFLIMILKIKGFNDWADEQPADVVSNYRHKLSYLVREKCKENDFFSPFRELNDSIVLIMKHETKMVTIMWRILESAATFSVELMKIVKRLNQDFQATLDVLVVLFKLAEPPIYLGNHQMQLADFRSDAVFQAEEHSIGAISDAVNYTSQTIEKMIVPNTTKVKSLHTASGEPYEISIVV